MVKILRSVFSRCFSSLELLKDIVPPLMVSSEKCNIACPFLFPQCLSQTNCSRISLTGVVDNNCAMAIFFNCFSSFSCGTFFSKSCLFLKFHNFSCLCTFLFLTFVLITKGGYFRWGLGMIIHWMLMSAVTSDYLEQTLNFRCFLMLLMFHWCVLCTVILRPFMCIFLPVCASKLS